MTTPVTTALLWLSSAVIVLGLGYTALMFLLSRGVRRPAAPAEPAPFYVFLMACLDEEKVLAASLQRLRSLPGELAVLVVDDASSDATADIVRAAAAEDDRIWLLQRSLPDARRGKGAALNAGLAHLTGSGLLAGRDPARVVVCVLDADGRLDADALDEVTPYFADPATGGVQIGVRMYNRHAGLLARMQDMEFVVYTDVFQNGRRHLGSVGLGGNGQFMRLDALAGLGADPWSDCLTEDLDLGVRLLAAGWRNRFCHTTAVHQQAVLSPKRLVRQRSRWFQGHLQAGRLLPLVIRRAPAAAAPDLVYHLMSPWFLLLTSVLPLAFAASGLALVAASLQAGHSVVSPAMFALWYGLSFGIALVYGYVYWRRDSELGLLRSLLLGHLFVLYGYQWFAAGWWAVGRALSGRQTWLKTART
ncbi:glycosyltransferase family 2 protein [Planomonospora venezuelensis]|uniref:Cellulose synthase/poly-beta-1,6-N-acetylglucosamine synthase-like glycosyltransferase n=1 Tax=Planomonospora venezuelensis TaxID=1999 RepID=A0A841D9I4_PLAVE|nr:glycosyltransferase family 2 protein [Planomonospora venezuelensis]MBB5967282.1 cellulose synthase/poly-beta-1,6-N-acetylglucosamine synthase-like glycosyltransferase [Planomonospora venezuelensis]GIM98564.1 N-acetyl-glucosamine transferase [Planomonospora venezuelensis]